MKIKKSGLKLNIAAQLNVEELNFSEETLDYGVLAVTGVEVGRGLV